MDDKTLTIICPECKADFDISSDLLGKDGRNVACSECHYEWFEKGNREPYSPSYEDHPHETTHDHAPPPISGLNAVEEGEELREKVSFFTSQVFLVPILGGLLFTGLFFGRNEVVRYAPSMEKMYSSLGISTYNLTAFRFQKAEWQVEESGQHKSITVSGHVLNKSNRLLTAPAIQVTARGHGICQSLSWKDQLFNNEQGGNKMCVIGKWTFRLREGRLFSGQTSAFDLSFPLGLNQQPQVLLKFIGND